MARRKRQFLEDDDSDSGADSENEPELAEGDPDSRAERALFENPYNRQKRRKVGGRDDATYGVFGEDSEDEGFGGRPKPKEKRSDWTKPPTFVSGESATLKKSVEEENEEKDVEEDDSDDDEGSDSSAQTSSKPPSPRVRTEEDEADDSFPKPQFSGIGIGSKAPEIEKPSSSAPSNFSTGGIGSSTGGIGSSKGGIGSHASGDRTTGSFPSSFGASRPQRSFLRDGGGSATASRPGTPTPLSATERMHFNKLQGSFGARMLAKMGWEAGTGLGAEAVGIVTPVESKLRPKGMGIAFKGFKEKTAQSKAEARRRGEVVSDDDDEKVGKRSKGKGKGVQQQAAREDTWKKPKKSKRKVEHKTYEEIIAEAGAEPHPSSIGKIIDATGATLREVSSLADVSIASWTPSADPMRIPEVRHNLRLIADACKVDLDGLAREAKALEERKKWVRDEGTRLTQKIEEEADLIRRLQGVHLVVDDVNTKVKDMATSDYEPTLEPFSAPIEKLLAEYPKEFDRYRLDEIIVAAIAPVMLRMMASWKPLEEPDALTSTLRRWRKALKMTVYDSKPQMQVDIYGTKSIIPRSVQLDLPMTPYESLLWNIWLPRVRSCINNDWSPRHPQSLVRMFESWSDILPPFIRDNILDQLILPKVSSAIASWSARKDTVSLQSIVFPWLPHVGLRMDEFVDEARRKVRSLLRSWTTSDEVPKDLLVWKDIFKARDWEAMLLKYVVPKLGATLRDDFKVNPRDQNMEPLQQVLSWSEIIRPSIFGQLLETEFFPKWLDVLHIWLIQPSANLEEIAQWYSFWKGSFSDNVQNLQAVSQGFNRGVQLMSQAMDLGPDAPNKLPRPEHNPRFRSPDASSAESGRKEMLRARPSRIQEITFRSIVEDYAATHNLLFLPAGKVEEKSRLPLFRVAKTVDGRGGLLVYLLDDAVWAGDGDGYRAVSLENMVLKATKDH